MLSSATLVSAVVMTLASTPLPNCPGDLTNTGIVDVDDLLIVLNEWGPCADCADCPADITSDCAVDVDDLLIVLNQWGQCPITATLTFDKPGTHEFVVPPGVTTISALAIGAGAHNAEATTDHHAGSSAGALSFDAAIAVTPGETLEVRVPASLSETSEQAHAAMAAWIRRGETDLLYAEGGRTGDQTAPLGGAALNGVGAVTRSGGAGGAAGSSAGGGGGGAPTIGMDGTDGAGGSGDTPGIGGEVGGGDGASAGQVGHAGTARGAGSGGKGVTNNPASTPAAMPGLVVIEAVLPTVVTNEINGQPIAERMTEVMANERVAYAMVSDSNLTFGGNTGHYQGMEKALHNRFGLHGVGIRPAGTSVGGAGAWFNGVRARNLSGDDVLSGDDELLPLEFRDYLTINEFSKFAGLLDGDTLSVTAASQLHINSDDHATEPSLVGVQQAMKFYMQLGVWKNEDATGDNPNVRLNIAEGTSTIAETILDPVDTLGDQCNVTQVETDIPADSGRSNRLEVRYWRHGSTASQLTGPFYGMYLWAELSDVLAGPLVHAFRSNGGMGLRQSMQQMEDAEDIAIENHLALMRTTLPETNPKLIIHITHGGNDRNDHQPSWDGNAWGNPDMPAGKTGLGFRNNLRYMMDFVLDHAIAIGYNHDDVYFILTYHPQPGHVETLRSFEFGAATLATDYQLVIVRGTAITSPEEMVENQWYNSYNGFFGDHAHLSKAGYEGFNALVLGQLPDPQTAASTAAEGMKPSGERATETNAKMLAPAANTRQRSADDR